MNNLTNIVPVEISDIVYHVAASHNVSESDILGKSKKQQIVALRHLAVYLCCYRGYILQDIAEYFNYKDHTGALFARNRVENDLSTKHCIIVNTLKRYSRYYKNKHHVVQ